MVTEIHLSKIELLFCFTNCIFFLFYVKNSIYEILLSCYLCNIHIILVSYSN